MKVNKKYPQNFAIKREERELVNQHRAIVIWFTGLSGAGKSTLANELERSLHANGKSTYILDGDNVRLGLNRDLGFDNADRTENIRRIAEVAKLMMDAGLIVITAVISPFDADRKMAKGIIGIENFFEIYVDTPIDVCEMRDPKGLYQRAKMGEIANLTGINSSYEIPLNPNLKINTSKLTTIEAVVLIYKEIHKQMEVV